MWCCFIFNFTQYRYVILGKNKTGLSHVIMQELARLSFKLKTLSSVVNLYQILKERSKKKKNWKQKSGNDFPSSQFSHLTYFAADLTPLVTSLL